MKAAIPIAQSQSQVQAEITCNERPELSVVIAISERYDDLRDLFLQYTRELLSTGLTHEFIFVVDGANPGALGALKALKEEYPAIKVIALSRRFGEATALSAGFETAGGKIIITLPSYLQVMPHGIHQALAKLIENDQDIVVGRRFPRIDSVFNRTQSRVFHWLVQMLTGTRFHDVNCGLRVMKRKVAEEIQLYGDLHRFFPVLADQRGFRIAETPVQQSPRDMQRRVYGPGVYLRRLLDILTLYFLYKFTRKPLRFFGLVGSGVFFAGAILTAYLGIDRLLGVPLANRPLLILGVLWMVFGVQLFSIGLLGEIIIFTHAREVKDYQLKDVL